MGPQWVVSVRFAIRRNMFRSTSRATLNCCYRWHIYAPSKFAAFVGMLYFFLFCQHTWSEWLPSNDALKIQNRKLFILGDFMTWRARPFISRYAFRFLGVWVAWVSIRRTLRTYTWTAFCLWIRVTAAPRWGATHERTRPTTAPLAGWGGSGFSSGDHADICAMRFAAQVHRMQTLWNHLWHRK